MNRAMVISKQIIIDIACLDEGIVPMGTQGPGRVVAVLKTLSPIERRRTTRKFRKILKKAIHAEALKSGEKGSREYQYHRDFLYRISGFASGSSNKREVARHRSKLVRDYLSALNQLDI